MAMAAPCSLTNFRHFNSIFPLHCRKIFHYKCGGVRFLFSQEALGIPGYLRAREKVLYQFRNMEGKFRERMNQYLKFPEKHMIFTDDLKNMIHMMDNKQEDIDLCLQMLHKFSKQNQELRFGTYTFGPVVMRTFHHLGLPEIAFNAIKDKEFDGFFDQLSSFIITMDLLHENGQYEKVLEVFEILKNKQLYGCKFPKDAITLALASCYKMNTQDSFKYAVKLLQDAHEASSVVTRKATAFASALALKQNDPKIAMEMLSICSSNYVTVLNLRIMALAELDRLDDVFVALNEIIYKEVPSYSKKQEICGDIPEKLRIAANRIGNKEVIHRVEKFIQALQEGEHITSNSLDQLLATPILSKSEIELLRDNNLVDAQKENRRQTRVFRRKGLQDMDE